jgi:hypothetical protein
VRFRLEKRQARGARTGRHKLNRPIADHDGGCRLAPNEGHLNEKALFDLSVDSSGWWLWRSV